jgi:hypothetical protein
VFNNVFQTSAVDAIAVDHEKRAVNQAKANCAIGVFYAPSHTVKPTHRGLNNGYGSIGHVANSLDHKKYS